MNHSALTDLLYGVSLPGSQFPHLYNEGPGFESGWPRLGRADQSLVAGRPRWGLGSAASQPRDRGNRSDPRSLPLREVRALPEVAQSWLREVSVPNVPFTVIISITSSWPSPPFVTLAPVGHASPAGLLAHPPPPNLPPSHRISSITADRSHLPVCLLDLPGAGRGARLGRRLRFLTQGFLKVPRSYRPGPPPSGLALSKQPTGEPGACQTTIPQTRGGPGQSQPGRRAASRPPHLVP